MAPTIHCVRHAQGFHNLGPGYYDLPDPRLTPLGEEQCSSLQSAHFSDQSKISLVIASPLARTLQTASVTFKPALKNEKCIPQILALPDTQETSDMPCDTGSDPDVLKGIIEEQHWSVDLSLVKDGWNVKSLSNRYSPASDAIKLRARDARRTIREKVVELVQAGDSDVQVVLVTHGGFLHFLTDDWEDANKFPGTGWKNCETRRYNFENDFMSDGDVDPDARLVETMESRKERGKEYPLPGKEEQEGLFIQAMQDWDDQGWQNPNKLEGSAGGSEVGLDKSDGQTPAAKNMSLDRKTGAVKVMG